MALAALVVFFVGYIFYHSLLISILLCPLGFIYPRFKTKSIIQKRKEELNLQFKDLLYALSASMASGKPIEMAFRDAAKDLKVLYPNPEANIHREVESILNKLDLNETMESVLWDFAKRAHVEDIRNFVEVFCTCKRSGGNIIEIIQNTSRIIGYKIEAKEEIHTLVSAKRFEQKVLNAMPILMLILLSISAEDYISPIFTTVLGRIVVTIAILLLLGAFFLSKKIMEIEG